MFRSGYDDDNRNMCVRKKTVRERRIPFEITADADLFYSPANIERLKKSKAEMDAAGGTVHGVNLDD